MTTPYLLSVRHAFFDVLHIAIDKDTARAQLQFTLLIFVTQIMALASALELNFASRSERKTLSCGFFSFEFHLLLTFSIYLMLNSA
jgi:hypothetical protein